MGRNLIGVWSPHRLSPSTLTGFDDSSAWVETLIK